MAERMLRPMAGFPGGIINTEEVRRQLQRVREAPRSLLAPAMLAGHCTKGSQFSFAAIAAPASSNIALHMKPFTLHICSVARAS
jgi:hypothetical protein